MEVADRHPLDPSIGDDYSKCKDGCIHGPKDHCHCDYHSGDHGCRWGNTEFIRRLTEGWRENKKQLDARKTAHALGYKEDVRDMPEEWFRSLPLREESWERGEDLITSFVILPALANEEHHDSGYRRMSFVALTYDRPAYRFGGNSDNISFDGIGGNRGDFVDNSETGAGWQIECLPVSGLLNVWCRGSIGFDKHVLSTFEPRARKKKE